LPPLRPLRPSRFEEDEEEQGGSKAQAAIAWVMLAAILALGGGLYVMIQKSTAEEKAKKVEAAKVAAKQAEADSILKVQQDSLAAISARRADSLAKLQPKKPAPGATASAGATGGETAPPPPPSHFGIDIGTFLSEDRAKTEVEKLKGSTGLPVESQPVTADGVTTYRVVVGDFSSKATAEEKANELILSKAVREARVLKLKR
jgi:hypothetical protein